MSTSPSAVLSLEELLGVSPDKRVLGKQKKNEWDFTEINNVIEEFDKNVVGNEREPSMSPHANRSIALEEHRDSFDLSTGRQNSSEIMTQLNHLRDAYESQKKLRESEKEREIASKDLEMCSIAAIRRESELKRVDGNGVDKREDGDGKNGIVDYPRRERDDRLANGYHTANGDGYDDHKHDRVDTNGVSNGVSSKIVPTRTLSQQNQLDQEDEIQDLENMVKERFNNYSDIITIPPEEKQAGPPPVAWPRTNSLGKEQRTSGVLSPVIEGSEAPSPEKMSRVSVHDDLAYDGQQMRHLAEPAGFSGALSRKIDKLQGDVEKDDEQSRSSISSISDYNRGSNPAQVIKGDEAESGGEWKDRSNQQHEADGGADAGDVRLDIVPFERGNGASSSNTDPHASEKHDLYGQRNAEYGIDLNRLGSAESIPVEINPNAGRRKSPPSTIKFFSFLTIYFDSLNSY